MSWVAREGTALEFRSSSDFEPDPSDEAMTTTSGKNTWDVFSLFIYFLVIYFEITSNHPQMLSIMWFDAKRPKTLDVFFPDAVTDHKFPSPTRDSPCIMGGLRCVPKQVDSWLDEHVPRGAWWRSSVPPA